MVVVSAALLLFGEMNVMSVWLICLRMLWMVRCFSVSRLSIGVSWGSVWCRCGKMLEFFSVWWIVMIW